MFAQTFAYTNANIRGGARARSRIRSTFTDERSRARFERWRIGAFRMVSRVYTFTDKRLHERSRERSLMLGIYRYEAVF